jgi:hypothetical protein
MFMPYHGEPGQAVTPDVTMAGFGQGSHPQMDQGDQVLPPYWFGTNTDEADWVLGPVGPGLKSSTVIAINEGMRGSANGRQFRINGRDFPMAFAVLFEYDGLDLGDQRALVSQGDFRLRIQTNVEPHDIGASSVAIPNAVFDDELTLVVVWSDRANSSSNDYNVAVFCMDEAHPTIREFAFNKGLLGDANNTADLLVGGQDGNDPSEGVTFYGFWAWGGTGTTEIGTSENVWWTQEKVEKFAEDPFGMYRRAAIGTEAAPPAEGFPRQFRRPVYHPRRKRKQVFA